MMRLVFLSYAILLSAFVSGQNILARADSLYEIKNYSAAAPLYVWGASLAEFKGVKASSFYNAACCFALVNQPDSAFAYLIKAKEMGWSNKHIY